jgi:pimeloyl-ACP methyl ester carboxylesterase
MALGRGVSVSVELAYREYGRGAPLVVLHGLFGSSRNWDGIAAKLASGNRVLAVDLRNHGNSPWAVPMTYSEMIDDLRAFCDRHNLGRVAFLGHSVGGKTAMLFALLYGHLVDALIVVDIAPVAYAHTFLRHVRAMQDIDFSRRITRSAVDAQLSRVIPDVAERQFLMQNLVTTDGKLAWRINLSAIREFMDELTGFPEVDGLDYTGRCLFIAGGRSEYLQQAHHSTVLALFPSAELATIEDAGHRVHAEQPERFVDVVLAFLDRPGS